MKHITMLFAVGAAMMLLTASVAAAQGVPEGCTFADTVTTCVTERDGPPIESTQPCEFAGGQRSGEQTVSQPTKIYTTTVYQGQGTTVIEGPTDSAPIPVGEPTLGKCKNVPGSQRS